MKKQQTLETKFGVFDESETLLQGGFNTFDDAQEVADIIMEEFLKSNGIHVYHYAKEYIIADYIQENAVRRKRIK